MVPSDAALAPADERLLVAAAQRGKRDAFGAAGSRAPAARLCGGSRHSATHEDAEDAVQEGFLHAYRALDRFVAGQPFGAWLHRIVANAALDLTRRRRVREADELPDESGRPARAGSRAKYPTSAVRLDAGLATLSERQRAVIVLHDVQGFRHGEIGRLLNIPEGTARSDLFHARLALRRGLRSLQEVR